MCYVASRGWYLSIREWSGTVFAIGGIDAVEHAMCEIPGCLASHTRENRTPRGVVRALKFRFAS